MKNPTCFHCEKKRARWPRGATVYCTKNCAAKSGLRLPEAMDRWWCAECDLWTQDDQRFHSDTHGAKEGA